MIDQEGAGEGEAEGEGDGEGEGEGGGEGVAGPDGSERREEGDDLLTRRGATVIRRLCA